MSGVVAKATVVEARLQLRRRSDGVVELPDGKGAGEANQGVEGKIHRQEAAEGSPRTRSRGGGPDERQVATEIGSMNQ